MLSLLVLTGVAMLAFAGNSLLCRAALAHTGIDAATFTLLRLASGALVLALLVVRRGRSVTAGGSWLSAAALFIYAICFSLAYRSLSAATGALLLFGMVQASMVGWGLWRGERLSLWQTVGLALAIVGLLGLLLPGLQAPPFGAAALMMAAGVAWGAYSLRGRGQGDPTVFTGGNFVRATPMALAALPLASSLSLDRAGVGLALASGALTSGLGYAVWYRVLPRLSPTQAASVQLSVPVLAAAGGVVLLGESWSTRLTLAGLAIVGGVGLVIRARR